MAIFGYTSTPQLPIKVPQIPSNRDQEALNRGTLGGGCWQEAAVGFVPSSSSMVGAGPLVQRSVSMPLWG